MRLLEVTPTLESTFINYIMSLVQMHSIKAKSLGIKDAVCYNYTAENAFKYVRDKSYTSRLILDDKNQFVGAVVYEELRGGAIYLHKLYIEEQFRYSGIGTSVINYLKRNDTDISLEIWYDLSSKQFYKKLGFEDLGTSNNVTQMKYKGGK